VLFTGRNPENGAKTLAELTEKFGKDNVYFIAGDMASEEFCAKSVATALEVFNGQLDFLCNNAFPFTRKCEEATRKDWLQMMEGGPIAYATMIAEFVKQRGTGKGAITQTRSWTYNTAKGAVKQLTKCTAQDLAPNIRVNSISPAWVRTDEIKKATTDGVPPKAWEEFHMLRRMIEPEEVAAATVFLLSDDASAMTAHDMFVDGGYLAMGPERLGVATSQYVPTQLTTKFFIKLGVLRQEAGAMIYLIFNPN
jgi:NAD(P)-dependent dehydrogenase (short-subunit alcohol dehydrogenase family)